MLPDYYADKTASTECRITISPTALFPPALQSENTVKLPTNIPVTDFRIPLLIFAAIQRIADQRFMCCFFQYTHLSINSLSLITATDLIYPFDYFW